MLCYEFDNITVYDIKMGEIQGRENCCGMRKSQSAEIFRPASSSRTSWFTSTAGSGKSVPRASKLVGEVM